MVTSAKEQKRNWLFNGHPQEIRGICEKYQEKLDNISDNNKRFSYAKETFIVAQEQIKKWKFICSKQQATMERIIDNFSKDKDCNIWESDNLYVFNGYKFLTDKSKYYRANSTPTKEQEMAYEKAEDVLVSLENFVVALCQLRNWYMLYDYIITDRNQNPVSAKQFQKEHKMSPMRIPFIKGEYTPIYRSVYKNIEQYVDHLSLFAINEFERSENGTPITKKDMLPDINGTSFEK